jgi:hypothetical protein
MCHVIVHKPIVQFFFKSIVNVKIPSKTKVVQTLKPFVSGHLYRKISLDQV